MFFSVKVTGEGSIKRKFVMPKSPPVKEMMASQIQWKAPSQNPGKRAVLDRTNSSLSQRVDSLVRGLLAKRSIARPVAYEDDLGEVGLSSLDIVNLMLAVEVEFDLKISDHDMRPANFRSIARIEALVTRLSGAPHLA